MACIAIFKNLVCGFSNLVLFFFFWLSKVFKAYVIMYTNGQGSSIFLIAPNNNTREDSTYRHYLMVNTEIRLIIFFVAKDGETLCSQQKQDREQTMLR